MSKELWKQDAVAIPSYIVQHEGDPPISGYTNVSSSIPEWEAAKTIGNVSVLNLRLEYYEHFVPDWGTLSTDDKKTLVRSVIWPYDLPKTDLNALYTDEEIHEFNDDVFGHEQCYFNYVDISGEHEIGLHCQTGTVYVRLTDDAQLHFEHLQPNNTVNLVVATQGHALTIHPDFQQSVTVTFSTGANEWDFLTLYYVINGLYVQSFTKHGASL